MSYIVRVLPYFIVALYSAYRLYMKGAKLYEYSAI